MSDRRRREERQRSRSRSRDRHRRRERSGSHRRSGRHERSERRDRHGSHHRSGRERHSRDRRSRSRSIDKSRSRSRDRYSPHHTRGSRRSPYSPPSGQYGHGAGMSRAGGYGTGSYYPPPPYSTSRGSYPADYGSGPSQRAPDSEDFPDFGLTVVPGTKIFPVRNLLRTVEATLQGTERQELPQNMIRKPDPRVLPYMTEDRFTNFVKLDVKGIGTLLFFYFRPLMHENNGPTYVDRWHLFVKVRETGPDTGPGSANNGYAYVATLALEHTMGQDERLEFYRRLYFFQYTIKDIKPYLYVPELVLWYQARHNFIISKDFVDFIPTLWEQPVHKSDERWFTRQNWGINTFLRKNGIPLDRIEELYEQRKAIQSTLGLPEQMTAPTHSEHEEEEEAQDAEMDQFLLDIFRQNQE